MSHSRHYLVNVIAQIGSRALSMGAGFLVFVLVARLMGSDVLGQLAFVMAFILIFGNIADMGTMAVLAKDLVLEKDSDPELYFGNYLLLRLFLALVAILISGLFVWLINPELLELLLISSFAIPFVGSRFLETVYQVYKKPQYTLYSSAFLAVLQLSIALPLLFWFKVGLVGYLYGFVITQALYFIFSMSLALRLVTPRFVFKWSILRKIIILAAPIGLWSLFNSFNSRTDIFMLNYWRTDHEVGIYNAAYRILDLAVVVAATASVPLVPVLSKMLKEQGDKAKVLCQRILEITVILLLPIPIVLPYIAEDLVLLIYGDGYSGSAQILQIFAFIFVLLSSLYVSSAINLASDNIHHSWWSAAIAVLINVASNYFWIPVYGVMGAAIATTLSTLFMVLVSLFYVNQSLSGAFALTRWLKIGASVLLPYLLVSILNWDSSLINIVFFLLAYIFLIWLFRLIPIEDFRTDNSH